MPIFVLQRNGDLSVHLTIDEAASSMEAPDIENGEYVRCFDDQGNLFSISGPSSQKAWGPGVLTPTAEKADRELHKLLLDRLSGDIHEGASLQELVEVAVAKRNAKPRGFLLGVKS